MAYSYDEYPGFVGREGQKYSDEIERCEKEKRRAQGEEREPNFENDWLDLQDGLISWDEYQLRKSKDVLSTPNPASVFKKTK